ncbi:MAG: PIG-L family deacetylase [Pyrinomonadaceae bacterium]|nr:PIG-L family deacetylase [Pyrinomonadaceae bacterium]
MSIAAAIIISPFARLVERTSAHSENSFRQYDAGAVKLGLLLRRLQTTASAMHTGAHPDDEDSALIATLARGQGARVAYLSLTRGEGGQNRIGAERAETLGVIRTEELLQARAIDGGDQFFTRAYDFGFTKTVDEAAAKWGERPVLADMVRALRTYRPLVIISRFTGTTADGHGHHQLAGRLTPLAFRAAADPAQFPEQIKEGLHAWQARKLYVGNFRRTNDAKTSNNDATGAAKILHLNTGRFDSLLGRSYYEMAAEGRSQHKSQEMGALELRGEQTSEIKLSESFVQTSAPESSVFDGIDISVNGIAQLTGLRQLASIAALSPIASDAQRALEGFNVFAPFRSISTLDAGLRHTRDARRILQTSGESTDARREADFLLAIKEREFAEALQLASGVRLDVLADTETVAPGESFTVTARVFIGDDVRPEVKELRLRAPEGWRIERLSEQPTTNETPSARRERAQASASFRVTPPIDAPLTQPYWLRQPREGDLFRWATDAPRGAPFDAPLITGEAEITIGDNSFIVNQKAQYRYADAVRGEMRRDVGIVPALAIQSTPDLMIVPTAREDLTRRIVVRLTSNSPREISGTVKLQLPVGWKSQPTQASFTLKSKSERASLAFNVLIPPLAQNALYKIGVTATAVTTDERTFDKTERAIDYPHINTHRIFSAAETVVRVFDFKVARLRVGYIMGSGDEVPEAIRRMNLEVTLLDEDDLSTSDLAARFDVIVVGVRASQVRADFVGNNNRLLDFARAGGTLIVQYQRPDYTMRKLAPFPAEIGASARTTDERAPVTILEPAHPVFHFPNEITREDWQGWAQERSLYNFTNFDPHYTALLESHDANEPAQTGGEVYASLGRGHYFYTSYSWFRQLPEGVPGAYRLFANMLSLSKYDSSKQPRAAR